MRVDILWLQFTPQAGHERAGHRPALVISPASYNQPSLMLCCPMTSKAKGYPFEVAIVEPTPSVALPDQVKRLDWRARRAERNRTVTETELTEVRVTAMTLIRGV